MMEHVCLYNPFKHEQKQQQQKQKCAHLVIHDKAVAEKSPTYKRFKHTHATNATQTVCDPNNRREKDRTLFI